MKLSEEMYLNAIRIENISTFWHLIQLFWHVLFLSYQ